MEYTSELEHALNRLRTLTGISLNITAETPEEEAHALTQIRSLCTAYQEKYSRTHFLQELLTSPLPSYKIQELAAHHHIPFAGERVLLLLKTDDLSDDIVLQILKNIFPPQTMTCLIPLEENVIAILYAADGSQTREQIALLAHTIADTVTTEALCSVRLAYSDRFPTLLECAAVYRKACFALKIGDLFHTEQIVFSTEQLGVGQLLCQLPLSVCQDFLHEIFGSEIPDSLEPEMLETVTRFMQNNLNIAETARQLHMHRNTLLYRFVQLEKRTGLDIRRFDHAMTFRIACMVLDYLHAH